MLDVGLITAVVAGVLALLSPCSALLLPSFFAYAFGSTTKLLGQTLMFYLGLLLTLVPLGVGVSAASRLFYTQRPLLIMIAGWMIIMLGVLQILGRGFSLPFVDRLNQRFSANVGASWIATLALGAVYGLAGFCSGPILGAILTIAATQGSPVYGGLLLAAYGLGMAAPLFLMALLWDRFKLGQRRWLRGRTITIAGLELHTTSLISGLLFIAIGVLFLRFEGTAGITGYLGFGDTADLEFRIQETVSSWMSVIPPWMIPLAVLLISGFVVWRRWFARPSAKSESLESH